MQSEPKREVICADAIPWMQERGPIEGACAVTSLPDVSEVGLALPVWRAWFLEAVRLVVEAVPAEGAAVFFQSDIKRDGAWIDKGALVTRAAEDGGFHRRFSFPVSPGGGGRSSSAAHARLRFWSQAAAKPSRPWAATISAMRIWSVLEEAALKASATSPSPSSNNLLPRRDWQ